MSASRSPTRAPSCASATARLTDTVLFPTPPFPLPTRMTLRTLGTRSVPVPLLGARRTSELKATSTRESCWGESAARTASSRRALCGEAGVGSSMRTRTAFPASISTPLIMPSSPRVRPVDGSFRSWTKARIASELGTCRLPLEEHYRCASVQVVSRTTAMQERHARPLARPLAAFQHHLAVDDDDLDPGRVAFRIFEGCRVGDPVGIERHQVRGKPLPDEPAIPEADAPGGERRHPPDRLLHREQFQLACVPPEDARGGAESTRVGPVLREGSVDPAGAKIGIDRDERRAQRGLQIVFVHAESSDADVAAIHRDQIEERLLGGLAHFPR